MLADSFHHHPLPRRLKKQFLTRSDQRKIDACPSGPSGLLPSNSDSHLIITLEPIMIKILYLAISNTPL